jgi:hypothetical protein
MRTKHSTGPGCVQEVTRSVTNTDAAAAAAAPAAG